uniref:Uncharacterized protein n=1 Tax=Globodera rostochiensis TaxID=31243 RepID=A0A914H259_GLORO
MISRDLTCNEKMPPLDDGDSKTDMHLMRNGKTLTGRSSSGAAGPRPSTEFGSTGSLNHMTTVRDVVTRHFRNIKLNPAVDSSLVGYSKLGGLQSIGGHFDVISHNAQHQRQVMFSKQDCNGCMPTVNYNHNMSAAPTVSASHSSEDSSRHALLSPSSTSSSTTTSPSSCNLMVTKQINLDNNKCGHLSASSLSLLPSAASSSSSSILHPIKSGDTAGYYMKTVPMEGGGTAAFLTPPLPTTIDQQQQHIQPGLTNSFSTSAQHSSQWAVYPPTDQSILKHQQLQLLKKSGGNMLGRTAAVGMLSSLRTPQKFSTTSSQQDQLNQSNNHGTFASTMPSSSSPVGPNQQQQHTSPRPSILRGNASVVRRIAVDRDRPASVSGASVVDSAGTGTNDRLTNFASRGDGEIGEESPRKRLRKQHFDNSQLIGDKLMMEVRPNDRFAQSASAGPSLTGCWRNSIGCASAESAHQQDALPMDPLATVGVVLGDKNVVGGVTTEGKREQQPKKRGRPKMNCRTQQLPLASTNAATMSGSKNNSNNIVQQYNYTAEDNGKLRQRHGEEQQKHKLVLENHLTYFDSTMAITSKSIMIEMDPILQTGIGQKKRKYRKQIPEIDPLTGKKVRKKGSGRKSRKELAMGAPSVQKETAKTNAVGAFHNFALASTGPSGPMVETAEERDVIHTLCRFKSDKDSREGMAEQATRSVHNKPDEEEHSQMPSCSYGTPKVGRQQLLPLLADLNELNILRPLLRRCERGMNSTDNSHLGESYEEIFNFLRSSNHLTAECSDGPKNRYDGGPSELMIPKHLDERYDDFKNVKNSLRLLPVACAYFDASQRLLSLLRKTLFGVSLYHFLQETMNEEETDPVNTEEDDEAEGKREERLSRALFKRLAAEYEKSIRRHWQLNGTGDGRLPQQFLLQLDVGQTLDLLLHCVERSQNCRHRSVNSLPSCAMSSAPLALDSSACGVMTLPDVGQRSKRKILCKGRKGQTKRRRKDETSREEDEETEEGQDERADSLELRPSLLLKSIGRFCVESLTESALLDSVALSVEERTADSRNVADLTSVRRKQHNNSKTHQFVLRPSGQMLDELFKCVPKLDQCEIVAESVEGFCVNEEPKDCEAAEAYEHNACVASQQQQPKLRADVEEMMANCQWGSAVALAQLRHNRAEILNDASPSNSSIGDGEGNSLRLFDRTLRFQFPLSSTAREEQSEFLMSRLREFREIHITTLGLRDEAAGKYGRAAARWGKDGNGIEKNGVNGHSGTLFAIAVFLSISDVKTEWNSSSAFSLEEQDEAMPSEAGREAPVDSLPQPQQGRQSPTKRAAHRRALTQMSISSSAPDG